jgi:hypothetical protein
MPGYRDFISGDQGKIDLRVKNHPILGKDERGEMIWIEADGEPVLAYKGEPVAVALLAAGKKILRTTKKNKEPRGIFCAIGLCTDCVMIVNRTPNVRTCVTAAEQGMVVETQHGLGMWKEE